MPKGIYARKPRKGSTAADSPAISSTGSKEEEEDGSDSDEKLSELKKKRVVEEEKEEEEESAAEEGSESGKRPRKRRKKKRKALFTREKPERRAKAAQRAAERAERLRKIKSGELVEERKEEEEPPKEEEKEEELTFPQPSKEVLASFSPLQLLLDHLLRALHRKDPEEYFVFPVTDDVAPGYSEVVGQPMDFYTMRAKLDNGEYSSLPSFKAHIDLILNNAYTYNKPNTVYYAAARKLQYVASMYFSKEHIASLLQSLPFLSEISEEELGMVLPKTFLHHQPPDAPAQKAPVVVDNMTSEEIIRQTARAAASARHNLVARRPNTKLAFLKQRQDGTTALNVVTPESSVSKEEQGRKRLRLGDILPPPKEGHPGLPPWTEKAENLLAPVNFLDYGPYASFAPQLDSTWATLNKDDSARLLATYGDADSVEYAWSLRNFVSESGDYVLGMVDSLLDTLTQGEHSKLQGKKEEEEKKDEKEEVPEGVDLVALRSLSALGVDVGWLESLSSRALGRQPKEGAEEARLRENAHLLADLQRTQAARQSRAPALTLTAGPGPEGAEVELAGKVVSNLAASASGVSPGDLVEESEVRQCLGIDDDIDMDLFREFLVPQ